VTPLVEVPGALVVRHSQIHKRGLFAGVVIPAGTLLGEYQGRRSTWSDGCFIGDWTMRVEDELRNARLGGNALRFVNHHKPPNVRTEKFLFYAARDIEEGEEILMDYGHGWE
jgi:SET domain-containing protein